MIAVTLAAIAQLKSIRLDHPDDPIVRITVRDVDEIHLRFNITLEPTAQPDDDIQQLDGLTIALERGSVSRMDGVTLDYAEGEFRFLHGDQGRILPILTLPTLN